MTDQGYITEASSDEPEIIEYTGPTWDQGPITPLEEEEAGWQLLTTEGMTFDEWLENVPAIYRARLYDSIGLNLVLQPSKVPDELVEIFGEGYLRDPGVFIQAGLAVGGPMKTVEYGIHPKGPFESQEGYEKRVARQKAENPSFEAREFLYEGSWAYRFADPNHPVTLTKYGGPVAKMTFDDFMAQVSAGNPEAGVAGDDTLRGFIRGGSGWETLKYPLAHADRKDFGNFLMATPGFMVGSAWTGASFAASRAGVALPAGQRLNVAMLGQSQSSQALRSGAGLLRSPIKWFFEKARAVATSRAAWGSAGVLGTVAALRVGQDVSDPEAMQGIQTANIQSFQEALTAGDWEEAQSVFDVAEANGVDMSMAVVGENGQPFTYPTEDGQTVLLTDSEGAVYGRDPATGNVVQMGEGAVTPTQEGEVITLPGKYAASFGAGGVLTQTPLTFIEGQTEPEMLIGQQEGLFDENMRATRWYPVPDHADDQIKWEMGQIRGFETPELTMTETGLYRTNEVKPIFRGDDFTDYLTSLTPVQLSSTQAMMVTAGFLNPETLSMSTKFQPGLIDANTMIGMRNVMIAADANGYRDIPAFLRAAGKVGEGFKYPSSGGGRFRRAPFERKAYLAPDYDTLTQYVKSVASQQVGRKLNDAELTLMADKMGEDHRANFDITEKARRAQYDAAGRGGDPGFQGEMIDMEASFKEFFEEKYATEIERRDTVEDVYNSTQNFFGSLDNAANLIGR